MGQMMINPHRTDALYFCKLTAYLLAFFFILTPSVNVFAAQTKPYVTSGAQKTLQPITDLSTGAMTFEYPIKVPPGRNGQTPDLKLQYNSKNNNNDSYLGFSWTDNIPYIERVNKDGTNKLYAENYFYASVDGE